MSGSGRTSCKVQWKIRHSYTVPQQRWQPQWEVWPYMVVFRTLAKLCVRGLGWGYSGTQEIVHFKHTWKYIGIIHIYIAQEYFSSEPLTEMFFFRFQSMAKVSTLIKVKLLCISFKVHFLIGFSNKVWFLTITSFI